MKTMKTMKTFAVLTLVAAFTLGQAGFAAAFQLQQDPCMNQPWMPKCKQVQVDPNKLQFNPPAPNQPAPNQQPAQGGHNHRHHRDSGAAWGAFAGGTILGMVVSSAANQPKQGAETTVVYIQQPTDDDSTARQKYLEEEIERERAKARALEAEIERLRAER